jgi:hypothetical protein
LNRRQIADMGGLLELAVQHNDVYQFYPLSEAHAGQGNANHALAKPR